MSELLQYRFPAPPRATPADDGGGLGGHAVGNLLIAAMTAVEGGDFEEGVRRMNRDPGGPRPGRCRRRRRRSRSTPSWPTARSIDGQSRDHADAPAIERVWLTPGRRPAVGGRARRDRRGRPHRPRARAASTRASCRACSIPTIRDAVAGAPSAPRSSSATSRRRTGETTGFDLADARRGARSRTPRPGSSTSSSPTTSSTAPGAAGLARAERGPAALAAGGRPASRGSCLDDVVDADERPPPRSGAASPPRSCGALRAARSASGAGADRDRDRVSAPDVTRSERDLVTALRAELAAIDPSRAVRPDGRGGRARAGRGRAARARSRDSPSGSSRAAEATGRGGRPAATARPDAFDWDAAAEHCRTAWLRGRFLARGSLSLAGGRTHLGVRRRPGRGAGPRRPARGHRAAGRRGGSGAAAAS